MSEQNGSPYGRKTQREPAVKEVHILWITAGLSCDGDSVSVTAASQPSIEDIVLGAIPGLPKVHLHNPVLAYENGDEFLEYWHLADEDRLGAPSSWSSRDRSPTRRSRPRATGRRSAPTSGPVSRSPPASGSTGWPQGLGGRRGRDLRDLRRHPRHGRQPHRRDGPGRLPGLGWRSMAGVPIVNVPGCPVQPDNMTETLLYLLYQAAGLAPMIPLDQELRPTWLFGKTVHEGCDRGSYYEQADFAHEYGSPKCLVRLGCWGPVVNCNVTKRGWMAGIGGCPNVGGICIGCTMPGFPDKFMPFMDEPPGGVLSSGLIGMYGSVIRKLRSITNTTLNKEPKWRHRGPQLTTGYHPPATEPAREKERTIMATVTESDRRTSGDTRNLVEMSWDPITRIVGSLGIYTKIDFANRQVAECYSTSSIFRGYSIFMKGKDPRDAHFITSRICGICGDNHATCACYAQNMAFGIRPPAMAEWIVNLGEAAEYMFDHNIFQDNLVGVDFCEQMVKETNPGVWEKARAHRRRMPRPTISGPSATS